MSLHTNLASVRLSRAGFPETSPPSADKSEEATVLTSDLPTHPDFDPPLTLFPHPKMKFSIVSSVALLAGLVAAGELEIETLVPPPANCERRTKNGDGVKMQYKGTLTDGTMFDQSYGRGPYVCALALFTWNERSLCSCREAEADASYDPWLDLSSS